MAQFRQNPITDQWVSVAPERAARPIDYLSEDGHAAKQAVCPFCAGHEDQTPREILALPSQQQKSETACPWRVRVVENKYPFVVPRRMEESEDEQPDAMFPSREGRGVHEVVIESPQHYTRVTQLTDDELAGVLWVYRERLRQLQDSGDWSYALAFKNSGEAAGASMEHVHSQIVALPLIPERIANICQRSERFHRQHGHTLWADMIVKERSDGSRVVVETDRFVALCPFAPRQPYELLIAPKQAATHFTKVADDALSELAALLHSLIARLEIAIDPLAFNWMINTGPFDTFSPEYYHWHVEIVPRVTKTAAYEWTTGLAVCSTPPEEAARHLRQLG
mgnify:CR=1 FL=1